MEKIPTAEDFIDKIDEDFYAKHSYYLSISNPELFAKTIAIEFAKLHVEKIMNLQQAKYYAGETGYITKAEWEELLNIK